MSTTARPASLSNRKPRVLIVDDILDQLDLYAMALEDDCDVLKASRGELGYALACAEEPDVIVLDLLLPDVNGFEVCRLLHANHHTATIPIIFLTGDEGSLFKALSSPEFLSV